MVDRRRSDRSLLNATVKVAHQRTQKPVRGAVKDLSISGCQVETDDPLPLLTEVRIEISHDGRKLHALGVVVRDASETSMGVLFTHMTMDNRKLLKKWLAAEEVGD